MASAKLFDVIYIYYFIVSKQIEAINGFLIKYVILFFIILQISNYGRGSFFVCNFLELGFTLALMYLDKK